MTSVLDAITTFRAMRKMKKTIPARKTEICKKRDHVATKQALQKENSIVSGHAGFYLDSCRSSRYKPLDSFIFDLNACSMEGWLLSVSLCRRSNTKKKRWFCLVGEYLLYFSSRADTKHSNAKPLSIIPLKNSTVVPYFKESNAQYKSTAYSVVGVHGICIKHAGREEARMLAFNRFELEEWIEALRLAAGTPSPLYKRGWGIDALMTSLNRHDDSTLWEVQGPGLVSTKAGEQTTVAILPPKKLLHRLDASCFMVTVANDVGYLYELNVPEANEDGVYVCKYTPLLAGKYHLRVLVKHITFNPLP